MNLPLDTIANTHSRLAELYLDYLATLEQEVTHNPLLAKFGLRLDHEDEARRLRVPLRVEPLAPVFEARGQRRRDARVRNRPFDYPWRLLVIQPDVSYHSYCMHAF